MKAYDAPVLTILLRGSANWTLRRKDKNLYTSLKMKVFRRTAGTPFLTTKGTQKFRKSLK
jgi:hypothetical protein